jgi:hypothetical protein
LGQLSVVPGQLLRLQLPTWVPQSMRQLAPAAQLRLQLLLKLPPHWSQQVAPF